MTAQSIQLPVKQAAYFGQDEGSGKDIPNRYERVTREAGDHVTVWKLSFKRRHVSHSNPDDRISFPFSVCMCVCLS